MSDSIMPWVPRHLCIERLPARRSVPFRALTDRKDHARGLRAAVVCIDEIQKCPLLMDEVQLMTEDSN